MRNYQIAVIPGDGIGKEVIPAGVEVLAALASSEGGFELEFDRFDWGSDYYRAAGLMMPVDGRDQIKGHDAIYFGAVGAPDVPDHVSLWGLRLAICQPFDQYANVRPARVLPGNRKPAAPCRRPGARLGHRAGEFGGEYSGVGGRVHRGLPQEVATDVSVMTRVGVERIFRFAFALARSRPRKLLTIVTKSNAQRYAMVMWDEIGAEIAREFPDVTSDKMLVDAMTMRMTMRPASLDTIVASNLHADILSDLAAALAGSLGIAPTANLNPERRFPSMFEPIHGSALNIAGRGVANPIGSFWTASMMLDHLGEKAAAGVLMRAIERATGDPQRSPSSQIPGGRCSALVEAEAADATVLRSARAASWDGYFRREPGLSRRPKLPKRSDQRRPIRHCEEPLRRSHRAAATCAASATQTIVPRPLDCFASLAMTDRELAHLFLRVALRLRDSRRREPSFPRLIRLATTFHVIRERLIERSAEFNCAIV